MTVAESPHAGWVLALGLLTALVVRLWLGPIGAYRDIVSSGAIRLEQRTAVLERYRALLREPPEGAAHPATDLPLVILPEIAEAQAVALLQERLKSVATAG